MKSSKGKEKPRSGESKTPGSSRNGLLAGTRILAAIDEATEILRCGRVGEQATDDPHLQGAACLARLPARGCQARPLNLADDAVLLRAEGMARSMLQALPETPVQAVGINFGFREQIPPGHVLAMFNDVDDAELGQQGWATGERKLARRLTRDNDALALTMTYNGESVDIDFNFHTDTQANAVAQQAVEARRSLRLRDAAIDLLRQTYHLELEEDDDGDGN